jgi:hypothetical protein
VSAVRFPVPMYAPRQFDAYQSGALGDVWPRNVGWLFSCLHEFSLPIFAGGNFLIVMDAIR